MRKYLSNILFALVAVFAAGCVEVDIYPVEPQTPATVTLQLRNTDLVATRVVDVTDDSQCNEDLIENVQCFFTNSTDTDRIIYRSGKIELKENNHGAATITLEDIPANILPSIAKVYVVANYADDLTAETSIAAIKDKDITLGTGVKQGSFVMDGTNTNPLTLSGTTLSGSVDLERVAAKIVVKANINTSIEEGGVKWTPVPSGIKMTYKGGIVASKISAKTETNTVAENGYVQVPVTGENPSKVFTEDASTDTKYVGYQTVPFYSFPVAAGTEPKGEITMTIPWTTGPGDNAVTIEYAYEIPVEIAFERNKVYIIDIDVEVLGNLEGKELTPSYIVLNWKDTPINATLSKPQYLVVDQNYVVMNNVQEYSVGYASSDEVGYEIYSTTITQFTYDRNGKLSGGTAVYKDETVQLIDNKVVFRHSLDNTRADGKYDFLKQEVVVRIFHTATEDTDKPIEEYITFVQYPAMYVTTYKSTGNVFVNKNQSANIDRLWHYVGGGTTQGMSTNLYKISVGAFDTSTTDYLICDPREASNNEQFEFYAINNDGTANTNNPIDTAEDQTEYKDDTLTGYRATILGSESANFVAPEFIVASGYGYYQVSWRNMYAKTSSKYRCAGYQESGYPAGRWRIPTPAELEVIGKLCAEGKIDSIFADTYSYMSSNGPYRYDDNGTFEPNGGVDANTTSVRCVYDTWYWKDKCVDDTQFIWAAEGDTAEMDKSSYLKSVE